MSGMSIWEILLLGVGLSMDAFAVSICKGLSVKKVKWQHLLCVGAYFGIFQALMPTLGYFLGTTFSNLIDQFDHWGGVHPAGDYRREHGARGAEQGRG